MSGEKTVFVMTMLIALFALVSCATREDGVSNESAPPDELEPYERRAVEWQGREEGEAIPEWVSEHEGDLEVADLPDYQRQAETWVCYEYGDGRSECRRYLLGSIAHDVLDEFLYTAIAEVEVHTEEEHTARDRVRELFADGL